MRCSIRSWHKSRAIALALAFSLFWGEWAFAPPPRRPVFVPLYSHFELILPVKPDEYNAYSVLVVIPTDLNRGSYIARPQLPLHVQRAFHDRLHRGDRNVLEEQFLLEKEMFEPLLVPGSWSPRDDFLARAITRNILESRVLLRRAHDFALGVYDESGNFGGNFPQGIIDDVANILTERQALILITPYHNPNRILQSLSIAYPDDTGRLPLERRLLGRGLSKPLPRPTLTINALARRFFSMRDPAFNFPLANELFSSFPIIEGDLAELKLYAREPKVKIPWGWLLRRLIIAQNLTRLGQQESPFEIDLESTPFFDTFYRNYGIANEAGDGRTRRALRTAFNDVYLKRDVLQRLWVSRLYLEAVGDVTARAYRMQFGFEKEHDEVILDPDVTEEAEGKVTHPQVHLLYSDRQEFEDKAVDPKKWYPDDYPLSDAQLQLSPFGNPFEDPKDCSIVLHAVDEISNRADSHHPAFYFFGQEIGP